jgi:hypothetical protein
MGKKGRQGKPAAAPSPLAAPGSGRGSDAGQPPHSRVSSNAFIALFVLFQLAMPLRYYLSGGGTDERFSWRMFSTVRMQSCEVTVDDIVVVDGHPSPREVELRKVLHGAWVNVLERYRPRAVDKFLRRRCEQPGVQAARYRRDCKDTDGDPRPTLEVELSCAQKQSRIVRGTP